MNAALLLATAWVVAGNIWHAVLLIRRPKSNRPPTISEHAVETGSLLTVHRIMHSLPLICFAPLIFGYLLPQGHTVAGILLLLAAVSDSVETLSLNKKTAPLSSGLTVHYVTAWIMALSYAAYSVIMSNIAGVTPWVYMTIIFVCTALLVFAVFGWMKKYFPFMQMSYFVLISLIGAIAHIKLIIA